MSGEKKTYGVKLPVSGYVYTEVEATSEEEAIRLAMESPFETKDIEEWDIHEHIVQGNVCHAVQWEATAEEV